MTKLIGSPSARRASVGLPDKNFWSGKKVFVTGHTGFKGSWLCALLNRLGAEVHGYALAAHTQPNMFVEAKIEQSLASSVIADIRDQNRLKAAMIESGASIALHLAAQPLVLLSYEDPVETYSVNVVGTASFLNAIREVPSINTAIVITSDKCYENKEWPWPYRENDILGGFDPYSNSKACTELVVDSFRNSFFSANQLLESSGQNRQIGLATVRAGNVIGGGDWSPYRIVPDCMRALLQGQELTLRNPKAIRPWQHVIEPLAGYLLLAESLYSHPSQFSEAWNFGPNDELVQSVENLVDVMRACLDSKSDQSKLSVVNLANQSTKPHEAQILRLDCSKAKSRLAWQPAFDFKDTIEMTVNWYKSWAANRDMKSVTAQQIDSYFNRFVNHE